MSVSGYGLGRTEVRAQAVDVVRLAVSRVLEVRFDAVTPATPLTPEAGVDSLAYVEIIEVAEQHARGLAGRPVSVDDDVLGMLCSVGDLAGHLAQRLEGGAR